MSESNSFRILVVSDESELGTSVEGICRTTQAFEFVESQQDLGCPIFTIDGKLQNFDPVETILSGIRDQHPYALAFVDLEIMPGEVRYDVIQQLWKVDPHLHIVACLADSNVSWNELVNQLGWSDRLLILKKPLDHIEICQIAYVFSAKQRRELTARTKTEELRVLVNQQTLELESEIRLRKRAELMTQMNLNPVCGVAEIDETTGLLNKNAILERIKFIAQDADVRGQVYSVLFVDVDRMNEINAAFGLPAGDLVLRNVAQRLQETLRPNDVIGRYGGEEFVVGLRNCPREKALMVAERLRARVADSHVFVDDTPIKTTVCVGVATQDIALYAVVDRVLECADQALGMAKCNGRNRVEIQSLSRQNR